jgi:hypothetical protein
MTILYFIDGLVKVFSFFPETSMFQSLLRWCSLVIFFGAAPVIVRWIVGTGLGWKRILLGTMGLQLLTYLLGAGLMGGLFFPPRLPPSHPGLSLGTEIQSISILLVLSFIIQWGLFSKLCRNWRQGTIACLGVNGVLWILTVVSLSAARFFH